MYWYGWTATAALGALLLALLLRCCPNDGHEVLAGVVVGGSRAHDDGCTFTSHSMVSTLVRTGVIRQVTSDK